MTTATEAASRFTGRAQNYARFRPGYRDAVIHPLQAEAGWPPQAAVANIDAGTGLSSELFLRHGNWVIAVEPNAERRAAAERLRARYGRLTVVGGRAEATTLPDAGAGFVVAGTAFHWFDSNACRAEFRRIVQPRGWVVLLWNIRQARLRRS